MTVHWTKRLSALVPFLAVLVVWQFASATGAVSPDFLPSPVRVLAAIADLIQEGEIFADLLTTLVTAVVGFAIGTVLGIVLGAGMALSPKVEIIFDPLVKSTYSLPKTALVPLFILWFGIGGLTNILTVAFACLLPVVVYTYHGVLAAPRVLVWSARSLGTPSHRMFWRLYLNVAQHSILIGTRIAVSIAFVVTVASEMIVASKGMGKVMFLYGESGAYDYMFAAVALTIAIAFGGDWLMVVLGNIWLRWADPSQRLG
ncbi:ABC transporter permease [Tardiphaga sp.]|jgi:ABC-type nitrate/sulfonate/bicarbonate transport system permease component|uniref:ABC transporter permease n=1 Tax=Tardiphaga sp. TaxID=1926292 RepID=UPI0037DA0469